MLTNKAELNAGRLEYIIAINATRHQDFVTKQLVLQNARHLTTVQHSVISMHQNRSQGVVLALSAYTRIQNSY